MENLIPELEARKILENYNGSNNQLLEWKVKLLKQKYYKLTRTQSDYIIKNQFTIPKIARKFINIVDSFGDKLMEEKLLTTPPKKVWVEKILSESEKAYQIWGKILDNEEMYTMWIPKMCIVFEEKKYDKIIDYSKYDNRPPMEHQKVAIERLLANNKMILADEQGLGKTSSAIIASLESNSKKVLIICPSSLKINWKREIELYSQKKTLIVEGNKWGSTFDYYIINYDIIKNYHSIDKKERENSIILKEKFDLVIIDEAHMISNATAIRTKLINDILIEIPKVWLLTGTPMTSRPINYYNLLKIVESPLTLNWSGYVKRYCGGYQFRVNNRKIWNTSGATNLDELRDGTKNVVLRRLKNDILDLPDKIITPVHLELENLLYNQELEEFIKITKEQRKNDTISVSLNRLMKLRQIIAMEKIPYTCELIDSFLEEDKKVIVFTNFTYTLDTIFEKYSKISVKLDGRMNKTTRQESIDKFQNDPKIKIFVGNIVAAGVGITLTAADGSIMNDLSFVPAHHAQAEDRCHRIGLKHSVTVYYPIFDNTIETNVYNILQRKKNIIDQVMGDGEYAKGFSEELLTEILKSN